jgi:hypothetical protein
MFASKDTLLTRPSGGYNIARSVRLRSSATGYLSRTPSSTTNRRTWTWSGWMKRGTDKYSLLFAAGNTTDIWNTGTNCTLIGYLISTNQLAVYNNGTVFRNTAQVFRDPSAWYHIVVAFDTTQATAANRLRVYINGAEVTSWDTNNAPTQNLDMAVNVNQNHFVGGQSTNVANAYFDGYLTEVNFIDGQALTPSSFGSTNAITGVWQPAKYTGTYGTNGFYLNFSDNSNNTATTIGKDYSGNGNNWTPNNISVTAGITYDSMTDVPTLTSATAANYSVFNPLDIFVSGSGTTRTFADGNLNVTLTNPAGVYSAARGTLYIDTSIKSYFEVNFASGSSGGVAVCNQSSSWAGGGFDANAWGYITNGSKSRNGNTAYGSSYTSGSSTIIGVAVNGGNIWFALNGTWQASGDPATGANPAFTNVTGPITILVANSAGSTTNSYNLNCGQRPFSYTPPTGFVALNTYNLPASTITNGAGYMAATLYTGNGTSQSISNAVNGVSFQPDFVWVKDRSVARSNTLWDSVRGIYKVLYSNNTNAEGTDTTALTAFNSNGFSVGADNGENANGETFVGWQWKAGGTSASNTNGSITSTVSAGATQGFSVVTYTGTGSTATVGHGLGVAPNMVIVKSRSTAGTDWPVYHSSLGATGILALDSTIAFTTLSTPWNNTAPTSSVFTVGTSGDTNLSTRTYVAYCFAAVAGYSAFGSYTGNGSADGPFVYTNMRSRFVMIKRTDSAGYDWVIYDTSRSTYNAVTLNLDPNSSAAETNTGSSGMDITSNGFKLRDGSLFWNASGGTYIYMAFAEVPFKSALAR